MRSRQRAFTLIELLVVFAIIATLLSYVAPRYFKSVDRSKEIALRENLVTLRQALDKFQDDKGKYPNSLDELVSARYLRIIPIDPVTESSSTWVLIARTDSAKPGISDVKSGATGNSSTGMPFSEF